ncbi:MAG: efflux RND transporter periplasmic adaptor subunit [Desulfosarcinaceae bacterium]
MTRRLVHWSIALSIIIAIAFLIWHLTRPKPVQVSVKEVTRGVVERTVANTRAGTVKACRRAKLSPSVGGQIAKLPIKEGDEVKEGQLLLELWNDDLVSQAALADHELTSARSRAEAACLKADLAKRTAGRILKLRRNDVASAEQADTAVAEAEAFQAQCKAAQAEIDVRKAQVGVAKANVDRTRLTAPFDGVIAEINGERFEFVTPSPIGIATPPAVDMLDNHCFYVAAPIDEVDASGIRVGMAVRITMDAFKNRVFEGRVRRIADYVLDIEKQARTVDVEVSFARPDDFKALLAGYSADIEVILEVHENVVRVPTEAVIEGRHVFVFLQDKGKVERRGIRTGLSNWDWTEVLEGLAPGELVVTNVDNPGLKPDAVAALDEAQP